MYSIFLYFRRIILLSFKKQMRYKVDFIAAFINANVWMALQVCYIFILFHSTSQPYIAGATWVHMLFVLYCSQFVASLIFSTIIHQFNTIYNQINEGMLDIHFLKPIPTSLGILWQEAGLRTTTVILLYILPTFPIFYLYSGLGLSLYQWLAIFIIVFISFWLFYSILLLATSLNFYIPHIRGAATLIFSIADISRYPKEVYPQTLQGILLYIIPVFLVTNPLFEALKPTFSFQYFIWYIPLASLFIAMGWASWFIGLKRYHSAG